MFHRHRRGHGQRHDAGVDQGLQLVVSDVDAARAQLVEHGVAVSSVSHYEARRWSTAVVVIGTRLSFLTIRMGMRGWCRSIPGVIESVIFLAWFIIFYVSIKYH